MDEPADDALRRVRASRFATVPIVLAGTIAVAGLTGPVAHAAERHVPDEDSHRRTHDGGTDVDITTGPVFQTALARRGATAFTATPAASISAPPTTYRVEQGDTVSAIAARYGLTTNTVLALNGLSWNSIIHPGQHLRLSLSSTETSGVIETAAATRSTSSYHVVQGDTVSAIAARSGVSTTAILDANGLRSTSVIYPGQTLTIPRGGASSQSAASTAARSASAAPVQSHASGANASGAATSTSAKKVTIQAGQTLATIAAAHGVTVSALLAANGLTYTSTIYAGGTLVVPKNTNALDAAQRANAATIVSVGRSLGVPDRGIIVALAAAMTESNLRNLPDGDRDSVGLFQQRPSQGWGSCAQLQDTAYAARLFFGGPENPNKGKTAGLLDIRGWQSMSVTQAAQAVQVSAYPSAYGQWQQAATVWLSSL